MAESGRARFQRPPEPGRDHAPRRAGDHGLIWKHLPERVLAAALLLFMGAWAGPLSADLVARPEADPLATPYPDSLCPHCPAWNAPERPFQIHGNSWYVGTRGLAAVLVTSPGGHVLIDAGLPSSAPLIAQSIRALGFDIADVGLILNSHAHFDHAGGIAALQRASGARVVASEASARTIRRGRSGPDDPQYGGLLDFPPVPGAETFQPGGTITLGTLELIPHATPAHTPGGTTWSWRSCAGDDCLDLVFADSQTLLSAEGYRFSDRADLAGFEAGYAALEALACDILITPHPGASSFWERRDGPGGLVDPGACRRYAAAARAGLERRLDNEQGTVGPGNAD